MHIDNVTNIKKDRFGCWWFICIRVVDDLDEVINLMKAQGYVGLLESEVKNIKVNGQTLVQIMDD